MNAEESSAREECSKFERNLTMIQHDMKETQRKLELEVEQRQKAETKLNEVEGQLQTEVSARQAALGSSQQSVEKVQQLEKQVGSSFFCCLFIKLNQSYFNQSQMWNSLQSHMTDMSMSSSFRKLLKTLLFR